MSIQSQIEKKIETNFNSSFFEVINESSNHHVPPNSETHFKIIVVSTDFDGKMLIDRHRSINSLLSDEFAAGLHALTLHTFTPNEWEKKGMANNSPNCSGASK